MLVIIALISLNVNDAATELLYVMYIGSVARNRMSKKLERLLSVMLLPIIELLLNIFVDYLILNLPAPVTVYFYLKGVAVIYT